MRTSVRASVPILCSTAKNLGQAAWIRASWCVNAGETTGAHLSWCLRVCRYESPTTGKLDWA